ncbi:PucR family transcriptional regulator [Nocardioides alkalitolerans]|uniref:PucR family transcriptional regulator n=1 Tax=Nocardioides alkalitolerans TaxID=281714 RepID=UPI00041C0B39|nr:PucR family transcriptional regulator [Nocardioides alkalitolerans]
MSSPARVAFPLARAHGAAPDVALAYRPRAAALSRRIADEVCTAVAGYADPTLRPVVTEAISLAVEAFVDALAGAPVRGTALAAHFDRLGRLEAAAGHDLDAMRAAQQVVTQLSWAELRHVAAELAVPVDVVDHLTGVLLAYQQWLHDQAVHGFVREQRSLPSPSGEEAARDRLFRGLVGGAPAGRLVELARAAAVDWPPPGPLVVVAATAGPTVRRAAAGLVGGLVDGLVDGLADVLAGVHREHLVLVAHDAGAERAAAALVRGGPGLVALSWGIEPRYVAHAVRWTLRALRLARQGVIPLPADRLVRCADHQAALWLHADQVLREHVTQDLLAPLLALKPQQRDVLGETLLLWLQTRASAPVLAERLGVHHQTVRNRLRRVRELFGDALDDPAQVSALLQALEAHRGSAAP